MNHKATYLDLSTKEAAQFAKPYDDSLGDFLSTLLGRQLDDCLISQSEIPIARGGLGINFNFSDYSTLQFQDSCALTYDLSRHIAYGDPIISQRNHDLRNKIKANKKSFWDQKCKLFQKRLNSEQLLRFDELSISKC